MNKQEGGAEEIKTGELLCSKCNSLYAINEFIPNFLPDDLKKVEVKVRENFGYKWRLNPSILSTYKKRFLDEIYPADEDFIKDKTILNACCGIGIIDLYCAEMGAKEVVGFDISDSVHIARDNCREYSNTHFIKADLFNMPLQPLFDFVLCLAAVHHLKNPSTGFQKLTELVKKDGHISIWVYGYEGNEVVRLIVEPLRRYIGTKLPMWAVNAISVILGTILWFIVKILYRPCKKYKALAGIAKLLPMREYLFYIDEWSLKQVWEMVFDQLLSPITHYHKKEEIEEWVRKNDLEMKSLTRLNDNSWRLLAKKCVE